MIVYRNMKPMTIRAVAVDLRIFLENGKITLRVSALEEIAGTYANGVFVYLAARYNGEAKQMTQLSLRRAEVEFDYVEGLKTIELYMTGYHPDEKEIYYDGLHYGTHFFVTWRGPYAQPEIAFETEAIHEDFDNRLQWTLTSSAGYACAAVELLYYEKAPEAGEYTCTKLFGGKYDGSQYTHTLPTGKAGRVCYYRLAYCAYPYAEAEVDDNLTYGEYTTEVFTIGDTRKYPNAPGAIAASRPVVGGYSHVAWEKAVDEYNVITAYELERRVNGGAWGLVYRGKSTAFSDKLTADDAETLAYRVRSIDADGFASAWAESEVLEVIKSNIFVMAGGVLRPASQVYIGGQGAVGAVAFVGTA